MIAGLEPAFVAPELDPELDLAHCVTPQALDEALAATPEAVGAITVSPTYFGAVADVRGLAEVAHARGVPLVVDEAWGAHLHFSELLPEAAIEAGADLVELLDPQGRSAAWASRRSFSSARENCSTRRSSIAR